MTLARGAFLLVAFALYVAGCAQTAQPRLLHPGSAQLQQARAEEFDPYPLPDLGPPTEARPRGFLWPESDMERIQNANTFVERYGTAPSPGLYRQPRNVPRPVPFVPALFPQAPAVFVP